MAEKTLLGALLCMNHSSAVGVAVANILLEVA